MNPASRHRHHVARHRDWQIGDAGRAVAQLAKAIIAPSQKRSVGGAQAGWETDRHALRVRDHHRVTAGVGECERGKCQRAAGLSRQAHAILEPLIANRGRAGIADAQTGRRAQPHHRADRLRCNHRRGWRRREVGGVGDVRRRHRDGIRRIRCPIAPIHKHPAVGGRRGQDRIAANDVGAAASRTPATAAVHRERGRQRKVRRVGVVRGRHRDGVRIVRCAIAPTGEQVTAVRSCGQRYRRPHVIRAATGDCPAAQRIGNATHGCLGYDELPDYQRMLGERLLGQNSGHHSAIVHQDRPVGAAVRAVAQLTKSIVAHGPERAVRFHKQRMIIAPGHGHHVARHHHRPVGVAVRAIAQLAITIVAHRPERVVRFHKQRTRIPPGHGHHVARHHDRPGGVAIRAVAQLARVIFTHGPERAVRFHKQRM